MIKFINLFILWLIVYTQAKCQQLVTGSLLNHHGKVVSYATITNQSKTHGVSADSTGRFSLLLQRGEINILVSATGYKAATYQIRNSPTTIILEDDTLKLAEVAIRRQKAAIALYGNTNNKAGGSHKNCSVTNLEISMQLPPCDRVGSYVQKMRIYVTREVHYEAPFRIHFYTDKHGLPDQELTSVPLVYKAFGPGAWTVLDLSAAQIRLPDGQPYHASIEWLYSDDPTVRFSFSEGTCFGIALGMNKFGKEVLSCTRINGGIWPKCTFYKLPNGTIHNPMIQVIAESFN